jgi:hypothetical protein
MSTLLVLLALSCPATKLQNTSLYPWDKEDKKYLATAKRRCGQLYPDSPCLKLFKKFDELSYIAICGEEEGK